MQGRSITNCFFNCFGVSKGDVVAIIGSGGKTSLMFKIAGEAASLGMKVLVTTSTKMYVPAPSLYSAIDMSGKLFAERRISEPGVYVGGVPVVGTNKLSGASFPVVEQQSKSFDLVLIEADGAAEKSLKGWKDSEPVIPPFATKTIGVIDIQVIGNEVTEKLVHRLEIFSEITGALRGDIISISHIVKLIEHPRGLFAKAAGKRLLFLNKTESPEQKKNAAELAQKIGGPEVVCGSIKLGVLICSRSKTRPFV